ncbi:hypothetical protein NLU13_6802 [Sarocladium strictum]|uniref:Cytochrome P450 n=1 Tax=Sarocladium strictum TaxID=5046 RepID=A0AA39L6C9_SARSR|nr:hypothetical protein NLU13_6802 [Sarocladium strictum]
MFSINTDTLAYTCLALAAVIFLRAVLTAHHDPLKDLPGPFVSRHMILAISAGFWAICTGEISNLSQTNHALSLKYGPIVRLSPRSVLILDLDAFAAIYRMGSAFRKAREHESVTFGGEANIFSMRDKQQHSARRRLYARAFTASSLRSRWEPAVRATAEAAVASIRRHAEQDGAADVYRLWKFMTADVISRLAFGESFGMVERDGDGHEADEPYFEAIDDWTVKISLKVASTKFLGLLRLLPSKRLRKIDRSEDILLRRASRAVETMRRQQTEEADGNRAQSLFTSALALADDKDDVSISDGSIRSDATVFMFAGTDTTSTTLTYLVWAVLRRPDLQRRLEDEVASLPVDFNEEDAEALPLLDRVLRETLRLYGPANSVLPRMVPAEGVTMLGHYLPPGTKVFTQAWSYHRLPDVFPNPDEFDETRWIEPTRDMKRAFTPFGTGSRSCIGVNLAWMELRLAAALFFRECRGAMMADTTTERDMEQKMQFILMPVGGRCEIKLPAKGLAGE